jgi:hypothetical protein
MDKADFSQEQLILKLLNPVFYIDPKKREQIVIDSVEIQRLNTPQLNRFKTKVSQILNKSTTSSFMIPYVQNLCKIAIVRFYSEGMPVQVVDREQTIDNISFQSCYKIALFALMHVRETSSVSGSYKCNSCKKTNIFDISNDTKIDGELEAGRGFQLDFLDYCSESIDIDKKQYIEYTLTKPIIIEVPEDPKDIGSKWMMAEVSHFKFTYPTIKTYSDISSNDDRAPAADYYAIYEHLVGISDFDRVATQRIKLKNTINSIFNFKNKEFSNILEKVQEHMFTSDFNYDCLHCGEKNHTSFDMTNFFEYLKS